MLIAFIYNMIVLPVRVMVYKLITSTISILKCIWGNSITAPCYIMPHTVSSIVIYAVTYIPPLYRLFHDLLDLEDLLPFPPFPPLGDLLDLGLGDLEDLGDLEEVVPFPPLPLDSSRSVSTVKMRLPFPSFPDLLVFGDLEESIPFPPFPDLGDLEDLEDLLPFPPVALDRSRSVPIMLLDRRCDWDICSWLVTMATSAPTGGVEMTSSREMQTPIHSVILLVNIIVVVATCRRVV